MKIQRIAPAREQDGQAAALKRRLSDAWLRLQADINEARQFQSYEVVFTDREIVVLDPRVSP